MWVPKLETDLTKHDAIVRALKKSIENGELLAGDRLPAQRQLAYALGVNLSTVTRAFTEATQQGLLQGETGRGTFISPSSKSAQLFARNASCRDMLDLSKISPPEIDHDSLRRLLLDCAETGKDLFGYAMPEQIRLACNAARDWLAWRGYDLAGGEVALTAGAQAALQAVLGNVMGPGQTLLTEEFTFPGLRTIAQFMGLRLQGVACDQQGLRPDDLAAVCKRVKAKTLVITPNIQNPTGTIMGASRRARIAELVAEFGLTVVEDDVYGSYSGMPPFVSALPRGHILISSLSKCLSPALRFGFVAGQHPAVSSLQANPALTSWLTSPLPLIMTTQMIRNKDAMRIADRQSQIVRARWAALRRIFPDSPAHPATHLWLEVENEGQFIQKARDAGIEVVASDHFATSRTERNYIRCSLTSVRSIAELAHGFDTLKQLGARVPGNAPG
ncbi:PLP-dependent aminotransferase family protein [Aliiroseovarius crassostreae]|uniref:PLP-dependent aminotransferase family protein n=1 Tax=Aliiroseovarius crassostreae TaxID=154981 RepID=A0A9Q9HA47_9RHOB|nr:PLP-dependent aminotransferase family protein [Aliiroseovarius crassostreae]UWP95758.1 PLP-dependent aminotransferase family protein [Aliiroseovarius crassostreae]